MNVKRPSFVLFFFHLFCLQTSTSLAQSTDSLSASRMVEKGTDYYYQQVYDSAIHYISLGGDMYKELNLNHLYVESLIWRSTILTDTRRLEEAEEMGLFMLQEAEDRLEADNPNFLHIYNNLANLSAYSANNKQRDIYVGRAQSWMAQYGTQKERPDYARLRSNVGAMLYNDGEYYQCLAYQRSALYEMSLLKDTFPNYVNIVFDIHNISGAVYHILEKNDSAIYAFEKGISLLMKNGQTNQFRLHDVKIRLAGSHLSMGNVDTALLLCQEVYDSLYTHQSEQLRQRMLTKVYIHFSHAYTQQRKYVLAKKYAIQAIESDKTYYLTYQGLSRHPFISHSLLQLADIYVLQQEKRLALQTLQEAIKFSCYHFGDSTISKNPPLEDLRVNAFYQDKILQKKAKLLVELGQESQNMEMLLAGLDTYQLLISLIHRERKRYRTDQTKLFFLNQTFSVFEESMDLCMYLFQQTEDQTYAHLAFQLSEQSKATLLYAASNDAKAHYMAAIPDSILEKENQLKGGIQEIKNKLFRLTHGVATDQDSLKLAYQNQTVEIQEELYRLTEQIKKQYPLYAELTYTQTFIDVPSLQTHLKNSSKAMLEYFWGQKHVYVLAITGSDIQFKTLDSAQIHRQRLDSLLHILHTEQSNGSFSQAEKFLYPLYQWLIGPIYSEIRASQQLIIVPDGPLAYLTFDVLQKEPPQEKSSSLLDMYPISYANSATLLYRDNLHPASSASFIGYGPSYSGQLRLPYSEQEVIDLQKLIGGQAYVGQQATKKAFITHGPSAQLLHFAMHGFLDPSDPLQSHLLFQSNPDKAEEEKLYAYELYNTSLSAELAILSACHTGYGPIARGEGIRSLALAFQYAGCPSVVMSLWEANGLIAKDLMPLFYGYLKEGLPKDVALQRAKLDFLATSPAHLQDPRLWANFVLIGEADALEKDWEWTWILWLVILALSLYVGWNIIKSRKTTS